MNTRLKACVVGGGVIGGGWVARFLLNGWDVAVFDPDPTAQRKIGEVLGNARNSLPALYDRALPQEGTLMFHPTLGEAIDGADWIQESAPERLSLKHRIHAEISALAATDAIVGSSTSGFKPSELTEQGARVIVAHPFNPVYLLPLVELAGDADACVRAAGHLHDIGMYPLVMRKEIEGHIADRLLEAVWRESLWLVKDGIATTEEIDEAIRMGFGLRWGQMGLFETYRIAGGEAGMTHFFEQFGPALKLPWTKLMDVPELTPDLVARIVEQSDAQSGHANIRELERLRDDNLVSMIRELRKTGSGAGGVINAHDVRLTHPKRDGLPMTLDRQIPAGWTDYNGHTNEARYLEAGAAMTDRLLEIIGADAAYVAAGKSYFTAESHVRFLKETKAGNRLRGLTQVLATTDKKLHLFHTLFVRDETPVATVETLLLHVDLKTRRSCPVIEPVTSVLGGIATEHSRLGWPEAAGRFVGERKRAEKPKVPA